MSLIIINLRQLKTESYVLLNNIIIIYNFMQFYLESLLQQTATAFHFIAMKLLIDYKNNL